MPCANLQIRRARVSVSIGRGGCLQLDAAHDLEVFGDLYQCGYRCRQIDCGVEWHNGFNHHSSKHRSYSFRGVRPCHVVLKARPIPMARFRLTHEGKCIKGFVLLEVLGSRVGKSRMKIVKRDDLSIHKGCKRTEP